MRLALFQGDRWVCGKHYKLRSSVEGIPPVLQGEVLVWLSGKEGEEEKKREVGERELEEEQWKEGVKRGEGSQSRD